MKTREREIWVRDLKERTMTHRVDPRLEKELKNPRQAQGCTRVEKELNDRPTRIGMNPKMAPGRQKVTLVTAPDGEE